MLYNHVSAIFHLEGFAPFISTVPSSKVFSAAVSQQYMWFQRGGLKFFQDKRLYAVMLVKVVDDFFGSMDYLLVKQSGHNKRGDEHEDA